MVGDSSGPTTGQPSSSSSTLAPTLLNTQEFKLPRFSYDEHCRLHSLNQAGRELVGTSRGLSGERIEVLFPTKSHRPTSANGRSNQDETTSRDVARWTELATKCKSKTWGEGVVVEYQLATTAVPHRAEATVVKHPTTDSLSNGFSLVLTRQLPSLLPEFENLKFDSPPTEAELDQSTIEFAVAGLSRGLMSGTRDKGASLASVDADGFGTKVLSMQELVQLVDEFPQVSDDARSTGHKPS